MIEQTNPPVVEGDPKPQKTTIDNIKERVYDSLFTYNVAEERINRLINQFEKQEQAATEVRRNVRDIRVSRKDLIREGKLKEDETIIPIRLCDVNIRREQPPFVAFLKQSRRLAIFRCIDDPEQDVALLEKAFTEGMSYDSWEIPHFKVLDGAQTHGWDALEIEFDADKPLHVALNAIGHENLIFPLDARRIQDCEQVMVKYQLNSFQLRELVDSFGFSAENVGRMLEARTGADFDSPIPIFKRYFKYQGVVYVCWYGKGALGWLKDPKPLYCGVQRQQYKQVMTPQQGVDPMSGTPTVMSMPTVVPEWVDEPETQYPFEILFYTETEKPLITDHKGRVFLDEYKQEAATSVWSNFINSLNRASNLIVSPKNPITGAEPKQTETVIGHGRVWNEPMEVFHLDYPDPIMLQACQAIDVENTQETNQVSFAVNNRVDSRKTAAEINDARQQSQLLNSVQVTIYSTFIRRVYTRVWRIVQSQALTGKITFLPIEQSVQVDPLSGQVKKSYANNLDVIAKTFDVRAAGDIDVIQRDEKLQRLLNIWVMVQATPLGLPILEDIVKLSFPEDADRYIRILTQALELQKMQMQNMTPEEAKEMDEQEQPTGQEKKGNTNNAPTQQ
jgi:hypothetical protein